MKLNRLKKANRNIEVLEQSNKISYWQLIALQSRANGCFYQFEKLPQIRWQWPTGTWFQERLAKNPEMPSFRHSERIVT
jgi:hypothetical protein